MKWKYLIITLMFFLIPIVYGKAGVMCEEIIKPNETCKMITPVLNCTNYTYEIINKSGVIVKEGNLTLHKNDIYYFNFSEDNGEYTIKLCDGTTTQVFVERRKDNMLAITIELIIVIVGFALLGLLAKDLSIRIYGYSIAVIELILLVFITYLNELEESLVPILRTNFYAILLSAGVMGLIGLVRYWIRLMDIGDNMEIEEKTKWGRERWR